MKQRKSKCSHAKAILSNLHALRERRYVGDLDASDTLIDFERALSLAKLTKRQSEAIHLRYNEELTQKEVGTRMGIGQNTVSELLSDGESAIDEVYEMWAWMDGDLHASDFENVEGVIV